MSDRSEMYTLTNVGAKSNPCGTPFLIVVVLLRSPPKHSEISWSSHTFQQFYCFFAFNNFDYQMDVNNIYG